MATTDTRKGSIGRRIQKARWGASLTQEQLAERASEHRGRKITRHDILRWEAGRNEPRIDAIRAIATTLELAVDWFFEEDPEEGEPSDVTVTLNVPRQLAQLLTDLATGIQVAKAEKERT